MKDTSAKAYDEIKKDGTEESQESKVYRLICGCSTGLTRNEISLLLGFRINAVCGRVNSLIKKGLVKEGEKREDPSTRKLNYVVIKKEYGDREK